MLGNLRSGYAAVMILAVTVLGANSTRANSSVTISSINEDSNATYDLTAEGTTDWVRWVDVNGSVTRKQLSSLAIGPISIVGGGTPAYDSDPTDNNGVSFVWANGTPTLSSTGDSGYFYSDSGGVDSTATGYRFSANVQGTGTLRLHVANFLAGARLNVNLLDLNGPVASATDTGFNNANTLGGASVLTGYYDINFTNAALGDTVNALFTISQDFGSDVLGHAYLGLAAAALSETSSSVPEPAAGLVAGAICGLGLLSRRRRGV